MSERPLSPHLQVYRLPLTALISISHRLAGVVLSAGAVFWVIFLMELAQGEPQYLAMQALLSAPLGQVLLWVWLYVLCLHLCHGIRHLIWDTGHSFQRETLLRYASLELLASVLLTLGLFISAHV